MMWVILSWVMVASICYYILKRVDISSDESINAQNKYLSSNSVCSTNSRQNYEWVNDLISWIYSNVTGVPEPLKEWIKSLNEAAKKVSSNKCGIIFERFGEHLADAQPPKIDNVRVEKGPRDHLTIRSSIHIPTLSLHIVSSQRTTDRLIVSNMQAVITDLRGEVECRVAMIANQTYVMSCFSGRPEMDVELINSDPYAQTTVPTPLVEECIRRCLLSTVTNINVSQLINTSTPETNKADEFTRTIDTFRQTIKPVDQSRTNGHLRKSPEIFDKINSISNNAVAVPNQQMNKLIVDLQEVRGLDNHGTRNVHVFVEMDEPPQRFSSRMPRNGLNCLATNDHKFTVSPASEEILFEIYEDGENDQDERNFLGLSIVNLRELNKNEKKVLDLKLQGRPYSNDNVSGHLKTAFNFYHDANTVQSGTIVDTVKIRDSKGCEFRETCTTKRRTLEGGQYMSDDISLTPSSTTQITVKTVSQQLKEKPVIHSVTGSMENAIDPETQLLLNKRFDTDNSEAVKQLTNELKHVQHMQTNNTIEKVPSERKGRSEEKRKKEGSRDRSFFGEMRERLSGRFRKSKRSKSADIAAADVEEAVSLPPSRDPSRCRYTGYDTKYMESQSVSGKSRGSNRSLYQHSSLVLELEQEGKLNYLLIPPAVLSEPAAANLMKKGKKLHIYNDHTFVAVKIHGGVSCNVCDKRMRASFSKQGYQCRDCKMICHKSCHYKIDGFCSQSSLSKLQIARDIDWAHFLSHYPLEEFISFDGI
ncbi:unnamed protein product [Auanema sp. JU1783]|nr:unnamed protein product [Auanema sp. JU1783]